MTVDPTGLDWVQQNVLPPMWRTPDAIEELRTCYCQAPPSVLFRGAIQPEARLWDRDGRAITLDHRYIHLWRTNGICTRRTAHPTA